MDRLEVRVDRAAVVLHLLLVGALVQEHQAKEMLVPLAEVPLHIPAVEVEAQGPLQPIKMAVLGSNPASQALQLIMRAAAAEEFLVARQRAVPAAAETELLLDQALMDRLGRPILVAAAAGRQSVVQHLPAAQAVLASSSCPCQVQIIPELQQARQP